MILVVGDNVNHLPDCNDNFADNALVSDGYDYSWQRDQSKQFDPSLGIGYQSSNERACNDPYYVSKTYKNINNNSNNSNNLMVIRIIQKKDTTKISKLEAIKTKIKLIVMMNWKWLNNKH